MLQKSPNFVSFYSMNNGVGCLELFDLFNDNTCAHETNKYLSCFLPYAVTRSGLKKCNEIIK